MKRLVMLCVLAAVVGLLTGGTPRKADARPDYMKQFKGLYKEIDEEVLKEQGCGVCHGGEKGANKKKLSKYAKELAKALDAKNVKDADKIKEAFKAVEELEYEEDKTYGDLLKEGELPAPHSDEDDEDADEDDKDADQ